MEVNQPHATEPWLFIEGIDQIIRRDLEKHKGKLFRERTNMGAYQQAVSHAIATRKHYRKQIGGGKYNDAALREAMRQQRKNITHLQNKVKLTNDAIDHHRLIVDTLTQQLKDYEHAHAVANRRPSEIN